jgi:general secretion pathway protein H
MTLIEIIVVVVIIALGASGLTFSVSVLTRSELKTAAGRLVSAARYAYGRAVSNGDTVRISFDIPGNKFSVEEAHGRVQLARKNEIDTPGAKDDSEGERAGAVDAWAAARAKLETPLEPTLGASPFHPIGDKGAAASRFKDVFLGKRIQIVKLTVPHEPAPRDEGKGAVYFFPGGYSEHAVIQLSDGQEGVYSIEIHPLTGRAKVYTEAFVPRDMIDDPANPDVNEVER